MDVRFLLVLLGKCKDFFVKVFYNIQEAGKS